MTAEQMAGYREAFCSSQRPDRSAAEARTAPRPSRLQQVSSSCTTANLVNDLVATMGLESQPAPHRCRSSASWIEDEVVA